MDNTEKLDAIFAALANPTRRAILDRLAKGEATVNALAEPFEMSLPAISKHIRVLENADLVSRGRDAQFRPCKLNADRLRDVANWAAQYRPVWEYRFAAMDKALETMKGPDDDGPTGLGEDNAGI